MRLYKLFYGDSASGPLDMVMLRRAINEVPVNEQFSIAMFFWAIPIGRGVYVRTVTSGYDDPVYQRCIAPVIVAREETKAAVGLAKTINSRSAEIVKSLKAV